jgi:hypothetical protein
MINIDQNKFYKIGVWAFGIMAVMNLYTFILDFGFLNPPAIISRLANLVFSFCLFGFFIHLKNQIAPSNMKLASDKEMDDIIISFGKGDKEKQ